MLNYMNGFRKFNLILVIAILMIVLLNQPGECNIVVSPSLPDIGNKCVVVSIPVGYVVQNLDMEAWKHHLRPGAFSIEKVNSKRVINIEIGNDNLGRYKA